MVYVRWKLEKCVKSSYNAAAVNPSGLEPAIRIYLQRILRRIIIVVYNSFGFGKTKENKVLAGGDLFQLCSFGKHLQAKQTIFLEQVQVHKLTVQSWMVSLIYRHCDGELNCF